MTPNYDNRIDKFFGELLSIRRQDLNMSHLQVAEIANCSSSTVKYHERGACYLPRPSLFHGFSRALQFTGTELYIAAYYSMSKKSRLLFFTALRVKDTEMLEELIEETG